MADELVNMGQQFKGLPMQDLIGAPLRAACDAQLELAKATASFIEDVGFLPAAVGGGPRATRTALFAFTQRVLDEKGNPQDQKVTLDVPMLAIVNIPSLSVKTVDITFDMEVKSSFEEKSSLDAKAQLKASARFGPLSVSVTGSVSSHKESTRKSDNSAKYHVQVTARDDGMPEGLARVLDIMHAAIVPQAEPKAVPKAESKAESKAGTH
ncbi:MAG: DUF2589 domain-containing protein [Desulfovibrio sp.]|jgi:hypothetical protein|nr:DUF2589 domain-containing protein [Desulfovibrio sp.]